MLVLLTRVLLWASVGVLIWYVLVRIIPPKYLTWFGGVILILLLVASFVDPEDGTVRVIWRILSFPLSPLGASIVFLGSALSDGIGKIRGRPAAIALSILLISSIPLSAQWLVSDAEQAVRTAYQERAAVCGEVCPADIPGQADLSTVGSILVLGESTDIDRALEVSESPSDVSINTALAPRLIYASDLYAQARQRGAAPIVLVTAGTGSDEDEEVSQPRQVIRNILINNGVFNSDIRIENTGLDIYSSGVKLETLLEESGVIEPKEQRREPGSTEDDPRVVVVAPAIVMTRAALTLERMDLEVIAKPTDFYTAPFETDGSLLNKLPDLLPSVDALQLTTRYWNEFLSSMYYFLRGWLPSFNFGWDSSIEV